MMVWWRLVYDVNRVKTCCGRSVQACVCSCLITQILNKDFIAVVDFNSITHTRFQWI